MEVPENLEPVCKPIIFSGVGISPRKTKHAENE